MNEMHSSVMTVRRQTCGLCSRVTVTYQRTIHREMVQFMLLLRARGVDVPTQIRELYKGAKASTDAAYLRHWGFVRKPARGVYELTQQGNAWLAGAIPGHRFILMRDNRLVGVSGELWVRDVMGEA